MDDPDTPDRPAERPADRAADRRAEQRRRIDRIAERLRSLDLARLARPGGDGRTPADAVHDSCVRLVRAGHGLATGPRPDPPRLADHGTGDQWQVIAHEALDLVEAADPAAGRSTASAEQRATATALDVLLDAEIQDLRRRL